jgi:organic radical activating enzyme
MDENIQDFVNNLNNVSKTFCLAKYDQFTVHIHQAIVHSCHLSQTKNITEDMIENAFSYFNFKEIKDIRKKMKSGEQIVDCTYCWKIENNSELNSERHIKSFSLRDRFDEIKNMNPEDEDIIPTYLELSFSSICNFKCSYCNLNFSTRWKADILEHGDFNVPGGHNQISYLFTGKDVKGNSIDGLIKKFWGHFPEILKNLKTLRITGGEPTLQKELYSNILDYIIENPIPDLELSINTNLGANKKIIEKFASKLKIIEKEKKVKHINIFTSCDSYGEDAEFIREGFNYEYWKSNCYYLLNELETANINIMCTINNLCLSNNFIKFVNDIYDMTSLSIGKRKARTYLNTEILMVPIFQAIDFLDYDLFEPIITKIEETLKKMKVKRDENEIIISKGFTDIEIQRFSRVRKILTAKLQKENIKNNLKINFVKYIKEISRRNNKDYLKIFNDDHYQEFFNRINKGERKKNSPNNNFIAIL